jgi:hypothetical protein
MTDVCDHNVTTSQGNGVFRCNACGAFLTRNEIKSLRTERQTILAQLRLARELLFETHPCLGKYGDDGELQCGRCGIDFARDDITRIGMIITAQNLRRLAAKAERCPAMLDGTNAQCALDEGHEGPHTPFAKSHQQNWRAHATQEGRSHA